MPPNRSRSAPDHLVTAVLVSHDGQRWLPETLAALHAQSRAPERVVAVDTGSTDGSVATLTDALGAPAVVGLARYASYAQAVQAGLDAFAVVPDPPGTKASATQWVWLLHDDSAPQPDALQQLLAAANESPSLAAVAPKVLSWDGRRLLEAGLTVDSSGRVHTGLEPREVDQGQHDDVGELLAAGTAGLLIRRDVWDRLGGLDESFSPFGDDVDFGWRLNAAGERMRLAPKARMRHVAAVDAGKRAEDSATGRPGAVARRHGMQLVLANTSRALAPLLLLRYVVETLVRAPVLIVLARRPGAAIDELVALGGLLTRPRALIDARRRRRGRAASHAEIRPLLAGPAMRWRLFGDRLAEAFRGSAAADKRSRRRAPVEAAVVESGPVAAEAESLTLGDAGALLRLVRQPVVLLAAGLTFLGLLADRSVLGGTLHGGRLLPATAGAGDLWSTYIHSWHPVGLGSTTAAPTSLALLALFSSILLGKAWLAVSVLILGAVPLAGLSAYVASAPLTRSPWLRVWAAVLWAVLPVSVGAVVGGRLDVVVTVILLPLLARAVGSLFRRPTADLYRPVGAGLLLGIVAAFSPVLWPLAVVATLVVVAIHSSHRLAVLRSAMIMLGIALVVMIPWVWSVAQHPRLLVTGLGLPETLATTRPIGSADLLLLRPGGPGLPPLWVTAPLLPAALIGLVRARRRLAAQVGAAVFAAATAGSLVISHQSGAVTGNPAVRYWTGTTAAVAALGLMTAALVGADQARSALRRFAFGWRQPVAVVTGLGLLAGTVTAAAALLVRGVDDPLTGRNQPVLPVFAAAEVDRPTSPRLVVLDGPSAARGPAGFSLVRTSDGPRLGDADVTAKPTAADRRLTEALRDAAGGQAPAVPLLAEFGVSMLVVRESGADLLSRFADVDGLARVPTPESVVWRNEIHAGELVVLGPGDAAAAVAGDGLPADARPHPLAATAARSSSSVPPGRGGRLLVLAEPRSARWHASIDGQHLPATTAYGWAQAWWLPTEGGRLHLSGSGASRGWWLVVQLVAVGLALMLAVPVRSRRETAGVGR
jgi:GT2 family glycosyltransferase